MKIVTWNVNGIRSVFRTTFLEWLKATDPDIVCLQEIKADYGELTDEYTKIDGYWAYFNSAQKRGYAGVVVYTKIKPLSVETKLGIKRFDDEGRCLKLTFDDFVLLNLYLPHGDRNKDGLAYKLDVYEKFLDAVKLLAAKKTILAGDFNIAHTELDLYHPKQNKNNIMFTPEEREQIGRLINLGYTDTFRDKYPDKKAYTMWLYMANLRERDIGWRIDYIFVSGPLKKLVKDAFMQREVLGSDHGPYGIVLNKAVKAGKGPIYDRTESQPALF